MFWPQLHLIVVNLQRQLYHSNSRYFSLLKNLQPSQENVGLYIAYNHQENPSNPPFESCTMCVNVCNSTEPNWGEKRWFPRLISLIFSSQLKVKTLLEINQVKESLMNWTAEVGSWIIVSGQLLIVIVNI